MPFRADTTHDAQLICIYSLLAAAQRATARVIALKLQSEGGTAMLLNMTLTV